jgi:hypothetical protein
MFQRIVNYPGKKLVQIIKMFSMPIKEMDQSDVDKFFKLLKIQGEIKNSRGKRFEEAVIGLCNMIKNPRVNMYITKWNEWILYPETADKDRNRIIVYLHKEMNHCFKKGLCIKDKGKDYAIIQGYDSNDMIIMKVLETGKDVHRGWQIFFIRTKEESSHNSEQRNRISYSVEQKPQRVFA